VMNGSAFLIIPAPRNETDPWTEPSEFSRYYTEAQFAPLQTQLQTLVTAYTQGDGFNFSRAAIQLRKGLRELSPAIYPQDPQLRLEYFYNHFEGFYRAIWCYGIALVILIVAHLRKRGRTLRNIGVAVAIVGLAFQASGIVMRCMVAGRPPVVFRDDLFRALSSSGIFARGAAGSTDRATARASNANRDAVEHRSTCAGLAR